MTGSVEGSVTIAFGGAEHSGRWVLGSDGRLTVTHPTLGRRRVALLNCTSEELAAPLLLDILRQSSFPTMEARRGKIYADGAALTTALVFLGTWAYAAWEYSWLGLLLGWLLAFVVGGVAGIVWPVAVPVIALWLVWRLLS